MSLLGVTRNNGEFICHLHDTKFYKSVRLPNNLNAVLISSNSKEDSTGKHPDGLLEKLDPNPI